MSEGGGELGARVGKILPVVRELETQDYDTRERRERVIAEVAEAHISKEPIEVQKRAIAKYFEVSESENFQDPVVIDAVHAKPPGGEDMTGEIASIIGKINDLTVMISKKGRDDLADSNRRTFWRKVRSNAESEDVFVREWPTSSRAALYWGVRKTIEKMNLLDDKGELKKPFMRLAIHGMKDREYLKGIDENLQEVPIDIVIGGGSNHKAEDTASISVLRWVASSLVKKSFENGVVFGDGNRRVRVSIEWKESEEAEVYSIGSNGEVVVERISKNFSTGKKSALSGSGLGLEDFRNGATFMEPNVNGERELHIDGMGEGFQTIQLELSTSIRTNETIRDGVVKILGEMSSEFGGVFPDLDSLTNNQVGK